MLSGERLISADAMRKEWLENGENEYVYDTNAVLDSIDAQPTVDAVEVVHSAWILNDDGSGTCKHCHRTTKNAWDYDSWLNYCPNCGAKMDAGGDNK